MRIKIDVQFQKNNSFAFIYRFEGKKIALRNCYKSSILTTFFLSYIHSHREIVGPPIILFYCYVATCRTTKNART